MSKLKILELFSGIGGMHFALKESGVEGEVVAAIDINQIANTVYSYNFDTPVLNNNIQKLTAKSILELDANTILMSPPCQPFTRVGKQQDISDSRSDALKYICELLPNLTKIEYIILENVKGFEKSQARDLFISNLTKSGFFYREFLLSPTQYGVPNTRYRYYCISRRHKDFNLTPPSNKILLDPPCCISKNNQPFLVKYILEDTDMEYKYLLPDSILRKRAWLLDIANPESSNTICFTKAYTHYIEGTGSVYTPASKEKVISTFEEAKDLDKSSDEFITLLTSLKLRYFTPTEVARLMSFPETFKFPENVSDRQKYRLLGNSLNVLVVSDLIKALIIT